MEKNPVNIVTINSLNNDCLLHIFQFLPMKERLTMGRVCKNWNSISNESWRYVKTLNRNNIKWAFKWKDEEWKKNNQLKFVNILQCCGIYLTTLDFSQLPISNKILGSIGKLCPNLQVVNFGNVSLSSDMIKSMTLHCQNVVEFSFCDLDNDCTEKLLCQFLENCDKLSRLNVSHVSLTGMFLLSLPIESINTIFICNCRRLTGSYTNKVFAKFSNLRSLSITRSPHASISELPKGLKILKHDYFYTSELRAVTQLESLERLDISGSFITNVFLKDLFDACNDLSHLTLRYIRVHDDGLFPIQNLSKLENLYLDNLPFVTGRGFSCIPSLKKLILNRCYQMNNDSFYSLVKACEKLENVEILNCSNIKHYAVEHGNFIARKRNNGINLTVTFLDNQFNDDSDEDLETSCITSFMSALKRTSSQFERMLRM